MCISDDSDTDRRSAQGRLERTTKPFTDSLVCSCFGTSYRLYATCITGQSSKREFDIFADFSIHRPIGHYAMAILELLA